MITYYCPQCWTIVQEGDITCPGCGYALGGFTQSSYEDKLIIALGHPVQERQLIAAQTLGKMGSVRALPAFLAIVQRERENYFLVRAVLEAAARIPDPRRLEVLQEGTRHPSRMIQQLARSLIEQPDSGR
jgi:HEAT repeat protein